MKTNVKKQIQILLNFTHQCDALRPAKGIPDLKKTLNTIEQNQMMRGLIKILIGKDLIFFHEHIISKLKIIPSAKTG
ncbi:MAG: hypothetical protein JRE65_10795 [Deltaproteobacteria bacterium]|jgi:hypothetical protein|nr:hypothetical protein [Deltaproteobacteria bacterium]